MIPADLSKRRGLASPANPADDGSAAEDLRALLRRPTSPEALVDALAHGRLLVAVSAVLEDTDESGEEKSSHMAVVSMINAAGEKGLLAFTGVDSMTAWDPAARPVLSPSRRGAACIEPRDGAAAVTKPARAVMRIRASAKSSVGCSASRPQATAAADIKCMATVRTTSTAGMSAMSVIATWWFESGSMAGTLSPDEFAACSGLRKRSLGSHLRPAEVSRFA